MREPRDFIIMCFFSNEMQQQQTSHIYLMSRATWTNDFLYETAMFTTMKPHAHYLISNYL